MRKQREWIAKDVRTWKEKRNVYHACTYAHTQLNKIIAQEAVHCLQTALTSAWQPKTIKTQAHNQPVSAV